MAERDLVLEQIERLLHSHTLRGSESLCKLLRYLAAHALDSPRAPIKEYQIATEVFGRSVDFDPQLDSMVRVQAGRLRSKLAEYYGADGVDDPVIVELPKGTYVLSFHHRVPGAAKAHPGESSVPHREEDSRYRATRNWAAIVILLSVLLTAAVAAIVGLLVSRGSVLTGSTPGSAGSAPPAFRVFWNVFVSSSEEPWVVFSNAAFTGRPETGMRYFDPSRDAQALILDHYTGVGEVLAVHDLDHVFSLFQRQVRVKRGSLFSLDDVKNNNLIFIGSPSENLTLLEIAGTQEFVFRRPASGSRKGDLAIINVHPQPGESKEFFATPANQPLTEDYAVIALLHGLNPAQSVIILAGTTTIGTQAAAEFVCTQSTVEELLLRLSVSKTGELRPFEAVIRVKVTRGVPVGTELVALRERTPY